MKLIYKSTGKPVSVGDTIYMPVTSVNGSPRWGCEVLNIREPVTEYGMGGVTLSHPQHPLPQIEFVPSAVGARWTNRKEL